MTEREGVIQFRADHRREALPPALAAAASRLAGWRQVLRGLGVLGREPGRYEGLAYGSLSCRVDDGEAPAGARPFLVSGTETAGEKDAELARFALVESWDVADNRIASRGEVLPSSTALSHAALYDVSPEIGAVLHGHAPELWRRAHRLGLPSTPPDAARGTPALAAAIRRLADLGELAGAGVLAMAGQRDGILAWGPTPDEAGQHLLAALARALSAQAP